MPQTDRFAPWLARLLAGDQRTIAQAMSAVEDGGPAAARLLEALHPSTGRAHVVGITGPPGSGKSTLVNALSLHLARAGHKVGVVAVDPSSPFTGGALLGDRVRMAGASGHPGVYIRSVATRGSLGGISRTTYDLVRVLDAAGYDMVIIETVGIGQSEVDIWRVAHTAVVIEAPGLGDSVQAMKAGVLEIAMILCVNKADLPGAEDKLTVLQEAARMASARSPGWPVPVVATVAATGQGVADLAAQILAHGVWLQGSDQRRRLEHERAAAEIRAVLQTDLVENTLQRAAEAEVLAQLTTAVADRQLTARQAAELLQERFVHSLSDGSELT